MCAKFSEQLTFISKKIIFRVKLICTTLLKDSIETNYFDEVIIIIFNFIIFFLTAYGQCNYNECSPYCQWKKCQGTRCVCDTRFIGQDQKNKLTQGIINTIGG